MKLTAKAMTRLRLHSQLLLAEKAADPVAAAGWMTALQGQDLPGVLYSLGLRTSRPSRMAVRQAFDSGDLVRTWLMRGTLHVCRASDLVWILSLTAGRMAAALAPRLDAAGIAEPDLAAALDVALGRLGSGAAGREELFDAFEAAGQSTGGQRGGYLLNALSIRGQLVQGPFRGERQLFAAAADWLPAPPELERDAALAELASRYFRSHAPATLRDFSWWCQLTLTDCRRAVAALGDALSTVEFAGREYLVPTTALESAEPPGNLAAAHLLPGFDEYLLGYADRSLALGTDDAGRIVPGNNGVFLPTMLRSGRVVGTWRKSGTGPGSGEVEFSPFGELSANGLRSVRTAARKRRDYLGR